MGQGKRKDGKPYHVPALQQILYVQTWISSSHTRLKKHAENVQVCDLAVPGHAFVDAETRMYVERTGPWNDPYRLEKTQPFGAGVETNRLAGQQLTNDYSGDLSGSPFIIDLDIFLSAVRFAFF